jgi:hypothetical protein
MNSGQPSAVSTQHQFERLEQLERFQSFQWFQSFKLTAEC